MTSEVEERPRLVTAGYGRHRSQYVKREHKRLRRRIRAAIRIHWERCFDIFTCMNKVNMPCRIFYQTKLKDMAVPRGEKYNFHPL